MIGSATLKTGAKAALVLLAVFVCAGAAADKPARIAPQGAVTLAYQFPAGRTLNYKSTENQTQNMDIMGQTMTNESVSSTELTMKPKGLKGGDFEITVTIDAAKSDVQTAQGNLSPDMTPVIGKSFDMVVSALGKEIDVTGAEALKINVPESGTRDLSPMFQAFFNNLPDKSVKIGDTWPSQDTILQKEGSGETKFRLDNVHTLDGFETVDGYECARIKTATKGTIEGTASQQGMSMLIAMKYEGQDTWYFAIKEGISVKLDSKGTISGTIEVGEPANMSIPITGETKQQLVLVKK